MQVVMVAFDGFTDIDLFVPWDLLNRVQDPFLNELRLDPSRQMIAGIDSGVLLLAKLGLLEGLSATTYPSVFPELEAMGIRTEHRAVVIHGNVATGGGCLATQDLAAWIVEGLIGHAAARAVLDSVAKVGS